VAAGVAGAVRKWRCCSRRRKVREWCSCGVVQWWPTRFRCVKVDKMMEVARASWWSETVAAAVEGHDVG